MITPLEIQNHEFQIGFRGFHRDDVRHFLHLVAEEFQDLLEQNHALNQKMEVIQARLKDMEARDQVLKDTLITAQQIKREIQENAQKEADLAIKEGHLKAEEIVDQAKTQVNRVSLQLAEIRRIRNDLLAEVEMMVARFTHFVEGERQLASESDRIHRFMIKPKSMHENAEPPQAKKGKA